MKAVILAAGKGTRMRELTSELPKPMLQVQGKPILEHIVEGIVARGRPRDFHRHRFGARRIENHFGDGKKWTRTSSCGRQLVQDGTGKAPELAKEFVGDSPFLLTYGDILVTPETYPQMLQRFDEGDFAGVITVTRGEDVTKGGLDFFDETILPETARGKTVAAQVGAIAPRRLAQARRLRRGITRAFTFSARRFLNSRRACKNLRAANTN